MDFRLKNGRPITIREFAPADLDGMVQMFQAMSKEALQFGLPPYDRPRLERWVAGLGGGVLLVAFDKAAVVGVAMVFGRAHARFKGIGEFVIYLHQDYHNQGLGSFLTKAISRKFGGGAFTGLVWKLSPTTQVPSVYMKRLAS